VKLPLFRPEPANTTRYLFFTGKGGVGKTSLSGATALKLAEAGKQVLLVSTDPASNLDEVLETTLTGQPKPIPGAPGLHALNINPVEAAAAYRERLIGPMRGLLPEAALRGMEEQLSGSCTVEIAAFDEFSGLIGNPETTRDYDHIIFDTAPTGHTLRLMSLAKAWDQFLDHRGGLDQPGVHHAREGAIHRAHVRHRRIPPVLDVLDDPVAVPLAGGKAEQDMKLDGPERQAIVVRAAVSIHSHATPLCHAYMHYAWMPCQVQVGACKRSQLWERRPRAGARPGA
jgi:anion-transporting  ArsA/GET3 family ATPase